MNMKYYRSTMILGILSITLFLASFEWLSPKSKERIENSSSLNQIVITEPQQQNPKVDPKAVEIFRDAMDYLKNLDQFSVKAQNTLEDLLESGHRVDLEISSTVIISRPNKLHTERHGENFDQMFYYDGEALTLYNPSDKVYATETAPATIDEMFHFVRDNFGLLTPASDLIYSNAYSLMMKDVNFAQLIGKEMIGKVQCYHLLFSRPGVDFQIWIAENGSPLPYKYVVTDTSTPELLAFSIILRNWNTSPKVSDKLFKFTPPQGTTQISFLKAEYNIEPTK